MKRILITLALALCLAGCGKTSDADERDIRKNLRELSYSAMQCMLETGKTEVRYDDLVGDKPTHHIRVLKTVNGESYRDLVFTAKTQSVSVTTRDGKTITYRLDP